ncbi:uncharacterized protein LOC141585876 isoform X2 [Silene latifolia]|uniref:uncharacterized protein LOC141585876 isoform X2 n=1 Tax=Silene latifolia TaxID=37657 RepID=UPI003D77C436
MTSATVGPTPTPPPQPPQQPAQSDRLSLESIPTVDLRQLSQAELTALSLCSTQSFDLRRCDDVVIPKIDRSVFNESAGSRKQTFSRLRLTKNPNPNPNKPRAAAVNTAASTTADASVVSDSDRADNARIVSLFKTLFNMNNGIADVAEDVDVDVDVDVNELALVPVSVQYCDDVVKAEEKKREEEEKERVSEREEREKVLVNKNGEVVNLAELAAKEDPYKEELRRRTEGRESAEALLGFITEVEGQWGSTRKKRKFVDACLFGDFLPVGWKVLIAIKKKLGRAWVFVRRYVSPNGRHFVSCKEVSSYLLSLTGPQELPEKPTLQGPDISMVDNVASQNVNVDNVASQNVEKIETNVEIPALPDLSQSKDHDNRQMDVQISPNLERQVILSKDVRSGEIQEASGSGLSCHRCSSSFAGKEELLNHLLSCHKRKRRKSGAPVEEDVVKDRKYECQFCDKIFFERSSYFGHVGMHVKNYLKNGGGTPKMTAKRKMSETVSVDAAPVTFSDTRGSAELNAESSAGTPKISAHSEQNIHVPGRIIVPSPDAKKHLDNGHDNQNNFSTQMELNVEAVQSDKSLTGELSVKPCGTENVNNDAMEIDEAVDNSVVKPDDCSGSDKVLFGDDNALHANAQEINSADCVSSEVCRSPAAVTENDDKQLDLGNGGSFDMVNIMENEVMLPSEFDLPAENEQKSGDQISAYEYEVPDHNCYDEELTGGDDELTYGSGSGHVDNGLDDEDGVDDLGSLEESSAVAHREEESCGVTTSKIEHKVSDFQLEIDLDTNFSPPHADQQTETGMQKQTHDFPGLVNQTEVDMCSESTVLCFPRDYVSNYIGDEAVRGSDVGIVQPTGIRDFQFEKTYSPEASTVRGSDVGIVQSTGIRDFQFEKTCSPEASTVRGSDVGIVQPNGIRDFQFEKTCSPEASTVEVLNKKGEDRLSNLFFTSGSSDTELDGRTNKSHTDISNELGGFTSFVGDKQAQVSKSLLSCLSMNEQNHEVAKSDVGKVSSTTTTMHFPGLDKVDSSRSNKSTLDFSDMSEINGRFVTSVQHNTVPVESSPFQLWGQQSCGLQENQSKVYGDVSGGAQRNRSSNNNNHNSLNMVGLQRPSGGGNNLNEVRMNEQSYVQHSETGVFSSSNEARREGNFHGNTLNLAGFSQQYESGYNYNKPCINQQSYGTQHTESGAYNRCDQSRQERAAYGNSLTLASVQQCDTRYSMNSTSQQTIDPGYGLNKGYIDSIQGLSKLDNLGDSRDRDLMIGFGNSGGRPNQTAPTEFMWRSTDGNIIPGGLVDSSSSQGQSSGSFQAFDFLSDKSGNDLYSANDKFDNMASFEGLRSSVEPMEFSFMTTQESNTQMEHPKVLQYNAEMDPSFANMMAGHVFTTLCVWCGNEFQQDPLACEMQAGSIGYLCPNCKARMSGQFL